MLRLHLPYVSHPLQTPPNVHMQPLILPMTFAIDQLVLLRLLLFGEVFEFAVVHVIPADGGAVLFLDPLNLK